MIITIVIMPTTIAGTSDFPHHRSKLSAKSKMTLNEKALAPLIRVSDIRTPSYLPPSRSVVSFPFLLHLTTRFRTTTIVFVPPSFPNDSSSSSFCTYPLIYILIPYRSFQYIYVLQFCTVENFLYTVLEVVFDQTQRKWAISLNLSRNKIDWAIPVKMSHCAQIEPA